MQEMYKGMINSPETTITNSISSSDTLIYVLDPARVPGELPNLMTLGTGTNAETIKVLSIDGNALTVERGFQGTPIAWSTGTIIARNFTEYDHRAFKENIEDLEANKATKTEVQEISNKIGILSNLNTTEKSNLVGAISEVNTSLSWDDIIRNTDFVNPINQRGVSGTISTLGYFIDGWKLTSGTVVLTSNGLQLNGTISQIFEKDASSNTLPLLGMYSGTATASYDSGTKTLSITSSGGVIKYVNKPFSNYGTELAKCQRYQYLNSNTSSEFVRASNISTNDIYFDVPVPTTMRINPTIEILSGAIDVRTISGTVQTGFTFTTTVMNGSIRINANKTAHGLTDAVLNVAKVLFNANL